MDFLRQQDWLLPRDFIFPVWMVGCGGIGSPTAVLVAKMGCPRLCLMDGDSVEPHNVPSQFFRPKDVGRTKVEALAQIVRMFTDECVVETHPVFFDGTQNPIGVIISGLDSMEARKALWARVKENAVEVPLYIDARLGGEIIQVYTVAPVLDEDVEWYEDSLFGEEEAVPLACTAQSIMYIGFLVAGLIGAQVKKWLREEKYERLVSLTVNSMKLVTA